MVRRLLPLVPAGALGGHLVGYSLVGHGHAHVVPHAHLPVLACFAVPLALIAAIGWTRHGRRDRLTGRDVIALAFAQSAAFVALELLERLPAAASTALLSDPAVAGGLAAQWLVAWMLVVAVRIIVLEAERFRRLATPTWSSAPPPTRPRHGRPAARQPWRYPTAERAPPPALVT